MRWTIAGITAVVLGLAIIWVLFVPTADWLAYHDVGSVTGSLHEMAVDNARGRLLTLAAGLFAVGALVFTARNFALSREGQVTDRYTKAIEQLGSDKLDVRIGGIYALERVARDSVRDHSTVMAVLTAFIREHSQEQWPLPGRPASLAQERLTRPDVQAAVTVVGRRNPEHDAQPIDLAGADLAHANLAGANLYSVNFTRANLTGTANLAHALLYEVNLTGANLNSANLTGANLCEANLTGAFLNGANLTGALVTLADLTHADLRSAFLGGVDFDSAVLDSTIWPRDSPAPPGWKLDTGSGRLERASPGSGPIEPG
jgi:uncharacterized protein YjbI with pentapeptide repeats